MQLITSEDTMERDTPTRKTVYRISLTLVKKESAEDGSTSANNNNDNEVAQGSRR